MPWRNAEENVPLRAEFGGGSKALLKKLAESFLGLVRLLGFGSAYPRELSGGLKQKVAIARALASSPQVLLMDEPFRALDAETRVVLREELAGILAKEEKTIVLVTHEVEEAILLCDRVTIMSRSPGRIKGLIRVDLPRPRSLRSMRDPRFGNAMDRIWQGLRPDVEQAMSPNPTSPGPKKHFR